MAYQHRLVLMKILPKWNKRCWKIFNVQLTFIVWTAAVVMGVKSKFSVPLRQHSMQNVLVLKWSLHLVMQTFYYSPVRLPNAMRTPAMRAYQAAPDPKICISYGACGCGGGIFHDLYCVWGGSDQIVPIDVYIPGCPSNSSSDHLWIRSSTWFAWSKLKGKQEKLILTQKLNCVSQPFR